MSNINKNNLGEFLAAGDDIFIIEEQLMAKVIEINDGVITAMVNDDEGMVGVGTYTVKDIMFFEKK